MSQHERPMTCEQFGETGFDFDRPDAGLSLEEQAAAETHLRNCPECAAQRESWGALQGRLRELARETRDAQTPERVELQLRRHVARLGYQRHWQRRKRVAVGFALAAAAAILLMVGVRRWEHSMAKKAPSPEPPAANPPEVVRGPRLSTESPSGSNVALAASLTQDEFVPIPGSMPIPGDDGATVQMRMQRGALGALGLAVNEAQADEWIVVDMLVSVDGQPEAVRLARTTDGT